MSHVSCAEPVTSEEIQHVQCGCTSDVSISDKKGSCTDARRCQRRWSTVSKGIYGDRFSMQQIKSAGAHDKRNTRALPLNLLHPPNGSDLVSANSRYKQPQFPTTASSFTGPHLLYRLSRLWPTAADFGSDKPLSNLNHKSYQSFPASMSAKRISRRDSRVV